MIKKDDDVQVWGLARASLSKLCGSCDHSRTYYYVDRTSRIIVRDKRTDTMGMSDKGAQQKPYKSP